MENASKALIIAGTILIAIVLISIGIRVFYSTTGTTEQVDSAANEAELENFNKKFTQYIGQNKTKTEVIELLNKVIVSNTNTENKIVVSLSFKDKETGSISVYNMGNSTVEDIREAIVEEISPASSSTKFQVLVSYSEKGYINKVSISMHI